MQTRGMRSFFEFFCTSCLPRAGNRSLISPTLSQVQRLPFGKRSAPCHENFIIGQRYWPLTYQAIVKQAFQPRYLCFLPNSSFKAISNCAV